MTGARANMKRSVWCLITMLWLPLAGSANSALVPAPPTINADSYLLVDFDTGAVLVEHNPDLQLPPASLTKLMTAYILAQEVELGRLGLNDVVPVSRNAWSQNPVFEGSSLMWIEPGKPVTVAELERGIVISSGNDATVAIAEHIAGSEAAFVDLMNRYAEEMGLTGTHFENSHGLPHPEHLSTARDLALTAAAIDFAAATASDASRFAASTSARAAARRLLLTLAPASRHGRSEERREQKRAELAALRKRANA